MRMPAEYWHETPAERETRVARQDADRSVCTNDWMELIYTEDIDELFAEVMRLYRIVGDKQTEDLLRRICPERMAEYERDAA